MKRTSIVLLGLALLGVGGCNQGTAGGPGATGKPAQPAFHSQAQDTFNLDVPMTSTSVKQGETKSVTIGIKRATGFGEDVTLGFAELPKGVSVRPAHPVIKHGDTEAKIMLKATNDAALGDFALAVTGHPAKGDDATIDLKINVEKK